jgi:hypothetical protein
MQHSGKRSMPNVIPLRPDEPRRIGRYRLLGRIADRGAAPEDAAGSYAARRTDGETVAVTLLGESRAADAAARDRFMAEARAARRVPPFCAARILDAGIEGSRPYLVAEFVEGPTLAEVVLAEGPLAGDAVRGLAAGAATGLTAIHRAGLVHGNLGPDTIVLSPEGPRIVHFSVTPPYGHATPSGDMLAWAHTVLYATLGPPPARRAPARHPRHTGDEDHAQPDPAQPPPVPPLPRYADGDLAALPADLRSLVEACLTPGATGRPSAREALTVLLSGRDVSAGLLAEGSRLARSASHAPTASVPRKPEKPPRRVRPAIIGWAAACVACLLAIVAAVAYITHGSATPAATASPAPDTTASHTGAPEQVPASLLGRWSGVVHQTSPVLSVVVRLSLGSVSGSISYPALDCTGSLAVESAKLSTVVVRQTIATGASSCGNGVITLTPQPGGKLGFTFARRSGGNPTGTLTREH